MKSWDSFLSHVPRGGGIYRSESYRALQQDGSNWRISFQKSLLKVLVFAIGSMSNIEDDVSDSSSDSCDGDREVRRAARDRMSSSTQKDYANALRMIQKFALDNAATFEHCICNGHLVEPVPFDIGKAYLAHIREVMVPWPLDPRSSDTRTGVKHYSVGKINNAISAIKYSFSKLSCVLSYEECKFYDDFRHSYKHIIARDKAAGAYPTDSGTVPLTMSATMRLLEAAMHYVPFGRGAAESSVRQLWLFLLISISTLGRGERVSRIQLQFISWFADSLTVKIPTSKSDTEGLMSYEKMCSANPWNPLCCLITALGVEFVSRDESSSFQFLFGGAGTLSHYTNLRLQNSLARVLRIVGEETLGAPLWRLTGHFLKKTGISLLRSSHECVSHDSRELRADHKVGPYNLRSDQDAVAGRILAFLQPGSEVFSTTPPHFHPRIVAAIPWKDIVPGYSLYSASTKMAVHACVASVVHNADFLDKNLSSSHPYHGCRLRKSQKRWVALLQPYVLGGRSGFKSMLEATGKSFISNICVDLRFLRQQSVAGGGAALDQAVTEIFEMKRAVERLTNVVETCPAFASKNHHSDWRIGYLSDSFRFPIGLSVQDAWFRWHDREKPLRAITVKMLPSSLTSAERARQCVLRRKIKGVMQILQGSTPDKTVDLDPSFVWSACWARCVAAFGIREPCTWTVTTFYDFLLKKPDCVRSVKEAPAISFAEALAAAAATTENAAQVTALFAQAAAAFAPTRVINMPSQGQSTAPVSAEFPDASPSVDMFAAALSLNPDPAAPLVTDTHAADDFVGDATVAARDDTVGASSSNYEYGAKKGVRCLTCSRLYYDKSAFNRHLHRYVDCARAKYFRYVIARETSSCDVNRVDDEPYPVMVSSVTAALEVQVSRASSQIALSQQVFEDYEYGTKSGVRCLICERLFYDKSGYNRHLARNINCESARSFRFVYKRMFVDEAAVQSAAAEFRDADGVHAS